MCYLITVVICMHLKHLYPILTKIFYYCALLQIGKITGFFFFNSTNSTLSKMSKEDSKLKCKFSIFFPV